MSQYFISDASPLKSGAKVDWEFADVGCKKLPVDEIAVDQPHGSHSSGARLVRGLASLSN
jgi:hypothetical protein